MRYSDHGVGRWTAQDEAQLQQTLARKAEILSKTREPLVNTIELMIVKHDIRHRELPDIADVFIDYADQIRDALQPFDSGVRVQEITNTEMITPPL